MRAQMARYLIQFDICVWGTLRPFLPAHAGLPSSRMSRCDPALKESRQEGHEKLIAPRCNSRTFSFKGLSEKPWKGPEILSHFHSWFLNKTVNLVKPGTRERQSGINTLCDPRMLKPKSPMAVFPHVFCFFFSFSMHFRFIFSLLCCSVFQPFCKQVKQREARSVSPVDWQKKQQLAIRCINFPPLHCLRCQPVKVKLSD